MGNTPKTKPFEGKGFERAYIFNLYFLQAI
jgi:hypothetical protein